MVDLRVARVSPAGSTHVTFTFHVSCTVFLAGIHSICIAGFTTRGTQVKVEHNLPINVPGWKGTRRRAVFACFGGILRITRG